GRALLGRGLPAATRDHPPAWQALLPGGGEVHRVPALGMRAAHAAALVLVAGALACRGPRPEGGAASCTHVQAERQGYGAAAFVRGGDAGPLYVAGFSQGAAFAYRLASREGQALAGLLILDGAVGGGRAPAGGGPAIDVGGSRLPFAERKQLLSDVIADPRRPSSVPGFANAGAALADIL